MTNTTPAPTGPQVGATLHVPYAPMPGATLVLHVREVTPTGDPAYVTVDGVGYVAELEGGSLSRYCPDRVVIRHPAG